MEVAFLKFSACYFKNLLVFITTTLRFFTLYLIQDVH